VSLDGLPLVLRGSIGPPGLPWTEDDEVAHRLSVTEAKSGRIRGITSPTLRAVLHGRASECAALDELRSHVRHGHGAALLLRGPAGTGKTSLLDYAASGEPIPVLRCTGIEAESGLAYSGLHQLLGPVLPLSENLPPPQQTALRAALGMDPEQTDRFLVSLATLGVLSEAAGTGLLCLLDDVQWIDAASYDAVTFAQRRLSSEPVGFVFAVRDPEGASIRPPGVPQHLVEGLSETDALAVLEDAGASVHPAVARRIARGTEGNPLALVELAAELPPEVLSGDAPLPDPLPVGPGVEAAYADQVRRLPESTQLVLLASASDQMDARVLFEVAARLGVQPADLEPAEASRLVVVTETGVAFRHPLIRSAVYRGASFLARQRVHRACAEVFALAGDVERRALHLAAAALGPDESVAELLVASARRSTDRGAPEVAATAWERAAELSEGSSARAARLVEAAASAWVAGRAERVPALLDRAEPLMDDAATRARARLVRGRFEARRGVVTRGLRTLMDAAAEAAVGSPDLALDMLMEAMLAALYAGDVSSFTRAGTLAATLPTNTQGSDYYRLTLMAIGRMFEGDPYEAMDLMADAGQPPDTVTGWMCAGHIAAYSGQPNWGEHYSRAVDVARATGNVGELPYTLAMYAGACRFRGDLPGAVIAATEGLALAEETGQQADGCLLSAELALSAAIRDDEAECREQSDRVLAIALPRGLRLPAAMCVWSLAMLALARGRPEEAFRRLGQVRDPSSDVANMAIALFSSADFIEAAVRSSQAHLGAEALPGLSAWAESSGMPYAVVTAARSRALLATEQGSPDWEPLFRQALTVTDDVPGFERGRTELLFGEALRRDRRPVLAREPLRSAVARFEAFSAPAWAERARTELRASGESVARSDRPSAVAALTSQELQIARMVAAGASNRAVAAALFLSPRTVEYHLYKIFPKLGIASRGELASVDLGTP